MSSLLELESESFSTGGRTGLPDELLEELFSFLGFASLLLLELDELDFGLATFSLSELESLDFFSGIVGSTCFGELGFTGTLSFLEELEEELLDFFFSI